LKNFLDGKIELQMIDAVISNYYENIDMLAPHHSVNYHDVSEYDVVTINDKYIEVEVFGNIHFTLEYGSKQERRDGDGLDLFESFPFKTKIYYEISSQSPFSKYFIEQFDVNTDEWYDEY
jgi:hypothetical protein